MRTTQRDIAGAGIGLRRSLLDDFIETPPEGLGFVEAAPENWMGVGGSLGRRLRAVTERQRLICHGLSLNLGGQRPLDLGFLAGMKAFFETHGVTIYSEHLSYCGDQGLLYDLIPIPFTEEAVRHAAGRIREVQERLERPLAVENVSYYAHPGGDLDEREFLLAVLEEADCRLLLDVNNVHVNAFNHGYDARAFIAAMPAERIEYLHLAGHFRESEDLIVDTHGAAVAEEVWGLLRFAYERLGVLPTLLERDFNLPPLAELAEEAAAIRALQEAAAARQAGEEPGLDVGAAEGRGLRIAGRPLGKEGPVAPARGAAVPALEGAER